MRFKEYAKINIVRLFVIFVLAFVFISTQTNKISATIKNTINFQTKITLRENGLNTNSSNTPGCVINNSADTCDFRIRVWNVSTGGTATAGNNLMYEELFNNLELGDTNGIVNLTLNSVCVATVSGTHAWGTTGASATVCNLFDDNGDADSVTGINFARSDLYFELTFDPSGAWTTLASPPTNIETFSRVVLKTAPSAFIAQTLGGYTASDFVQMSPTSIQNTTSTTGAIRINQLGSGSLIQLQSAGVDRFVVNNAGQIQLSRTGSTGGLILGDSGSIYRSAANTLLSNNSLEVALNLTSNGLSNFGGNLVAIATVSNGSTTASGTGTTTKTLTVASITNFDAGNLVLINGSTYTRIQSVDTVAVILNVYPAVSFTNGQSVVEYTTPSVGGNNTDITQQFDTAYVINDLRTGDTGATSLRDKLINGTNSNNNLKLESGDLYFNVTQMGLNSSGLYINKSVAPNVTGTWSSSGKQMMSNKAHGVSGTYQGKLYGFGGAAPGPVVSNNVDIYDVVTDTWSSGTSGGTAKGVGTGQVYNGKMYLVTGCTNATCTTFTNSVDIYDFATDTWTTGTAGGISRGATTSIIRQGSIYIWGGCNGASCASSITTLDIYNTITDTWTTGTAGPARVAGTGVLYNDKIYAWAGLVSGSATNTMDIYDIKTNTWITGTAGGTARYWNNTVLFENKIYAWAGQGVSVALNTTDVYDISSNTWTTGVTGGTARNRNFVQIYNNKMYAWGGISDGGTVNFLPTMNIFDFGINDTVLKIRVGTQEKFKLDTDNILTVNGDPLGLNFPLKNSSQYTTQGWSTGATSSDVRLYPQGVVYNGKIYYSNGCNAPANCGAISTNILIYDITTNTYSNSSVGGTPKWIPAVQQYNGKIYMLQGATNTAASTFTNGVDIYDIASNSWSTGLAGGTARFSAASVLYNGKIYIWGGNSGVITTVMDIYDIGSNTWSTGLSGGVARSLHSAVLYNGKIYFWGGLNSGGTAINSLDIYDIQSNTWSTGLAGGTAARSTYGIVFRGKMYVWGGFVAAAINTVSVYEFASNTWTSSTTLNGGTARFDHAANYYNGKAYYFGGATTANPVGNMDIFDFGSSKAEDVFTISKGSTSGGDEGKLFRFDATGRAYTNTQGGWFSVGADYAEYMHVNDQTIEPGDIVKLDLSDAKSLIKTSDKRDENAIGVISTEPGFVGNITTIEDLSNNRSDMKLLSMVGQVPVKVSTENGEIHIGDRITTSTMSGIGMKANEGDTNIGIAQEGFAGTGVTKISVLITRNNDGISNKLEISLGEQGKAGFRINSAGKMQFKNEVGSWMDVDQQVAIDKSIVWRKVGDNIFNNNSGIVSVGVSEETLSNSKLQVDHALEVKEGLRVVKLSSNGQLDISGYSKPIGIRINETNGGIEYIDGVNNEWRSLSGMVLSRMRVNKDQTQEITNSKQISGWSYLQGDNLSSSLSKQIDLTQISIKDIIVISNIIGYSDTNPTTPSNCNNALDENIVSKVNIKQDNKFDVVLNNPDGVIPTKFICFNWIAIGNN